jgi:hypothetical protein
LLALGLALILQVSWSPAPLWSADQERPPADSGTSPELDPTQLILDHESTKKTRTVGLARVRLSYPQLLSGAVGVMRSRKPADFECITTCKHRGLLLQVEPGIGGIQLGAGWVLVVGGTGKNKRFLSDVFVGWGFKGVLLRTWGESPLNPPDQTFAGFEGDFSIASTNFSFGVMRGIDPGPEDETWLITGGLGWGF